MKVLEPIVSYKRMLYQKAFGFSIRIVKLFKYILDKDISYEPLYKQLLRSGTSIGANISEAESAPAKKEFRKRLSISLKETREFGYWIKLHKEAEILNQLEHDSLINDCDELERLLTSSIKTARGN